MPFGRGRRLVSFPDIRPEVESIAICATRKLTSAIATNNGHNLAGDVAGASRAGEKDVGGRDLFRLGRALHHRVDGHNGLNGSRLVQLLLGDFRTGKVYGKHRAAPKRQGCHVSAFENRM